LLLLLHPSGREKLLPVCSFALKSQLPSICQFLTARPCINTHRGKHEYGHSFQMTFPKQDISRPERQTKVPLGNRHARNKAHPIQLAVNEPRFKMPTIVSSPSTSPQAPPSCNWGSPAFAKQKRSPYLIRERNHGCCFSQVGDLDHA